MEFDNTLFIEYKHLMDTTNIQVCYQEIIKLIKYIHLNLKKEMPTYDFTNKIIENRMDFSYFQITNQSLKTNGLKIQVIFIHKTCTFEVWMSGYNRSIQSNYFNIIKNIQLPFKICNNPISNDYITKISITKNIITNDIESIISEIKEQINNLETYFLTIIEMENK